MLLLGTVLRSTFIHLLKLYTSISKDGSSFVQPSQKAFLKIKLQQSGLRLKQLNPTSIQQHAVARNEAVIGRGQAEYTN